MRALPFFICLLAAGSAHALSCLPPTPAVWTPRATVSPDAFVVVEAMNSELRELQTSAAHFIDAAGTPVALKVERVGRQSTLQPARPLKGTARLVLPKGWEAPAPWKVAPATPPPAWTGDPKLTASESRQVAQYGPAWHRVIAVPTAGATLIQVTFPQLDGAPVTHYLPVKDGAIRLATHPCRSGVGGLLQTGLQRLTLRPVGSGGALGQPRTLEVPGASGGKRRR